MMRPSFVMSAISLMALLSGVIAYRYPNARITKLLFKNKYGYQKDVTEMSKTEALAAGVNLMLIGAAIFFADDFVYSYFTKKSADANLVIIVMSVVLIIVAAMFFLKGVGIFLKELLKKA